MYKILVADDEALECEALAWFIEKSALETEPVIQCSTGEEAMKQILLNHPDIIILDINMPGMNGLEVLEQIRKADYRNRVIFSTAYDYFEYARRALQLGAMDFLVKPVSEETFIGAVTRAIDELDEEAARDYGHRLMKETLERLGTKILKDLVTGKIPEEDLYYLENLGIGYETAGNTLCAFFMEELSQEREREIERDLRKEFGYLNMPMILSWKNRMLTVILFLPLQKQRENGETVMHSIMDSVLRRYDTAFLLEQGSLFEDLSQIENSFARAREHLGDLMAAGQEKAPEQQLPEDVEKICHYIRENYSQKLTLDEIAAAAGYSKYYVNRLFKQYQGTTVMDYLIQVRIEEAKKLLRSCNHSVKQISMMVGYSEPNYFTLTFKKLEGVSPLKYRYGQEKENAAETC